MLVKHLRDDNRVPFATIVADKFDNGIRIGVSVCHATLDSFNKRLGVQVAHGRAKVGKNAFKVPNRVVLYRGQHRKISQIIHFERDEMWDRCDKYYKVAVDK